MVDSRIRFSLDARCSKTSARVGTLRTRRTIVETPVFMPVATQGALRGVDLSQAESLGYRILLANTYHLLLRLGPTLIKDLGGLNKFSNWGHTFLTDSGGYQIFSLAKQLKLTEEGAIFRSYIDGAKIELTPESSIQMQSAIDSDIMMVLDHCIDSTSDQETTKAALELTTRWAKRSLAARGDSTQALFGIVQGACFPELRKVSAEQITALPFDGFAIGGLAVGETKQEREDIAEFTAKLLPEDKPRYLMGVGTPIDLLEAVKRGLDMFDCILPTSLAHQGVCFTSNGKVDLRRGRYKGSKNPLDPKCGCSTCIRYSTGYLAHLISSGEFVADQLLSIHNLQFYKSLMDGIRTSIKSDLFSEFYSSTRPILEAVEGQSGIVTRKTQLKRAPQLGDYEISQDPLGRFSSIRQISSGETMHSVSNPTEEASSLYIRQPDILNRVIGRSFVVWDVGLGAATNAMCLVKQALETELKDSQLSIISFERDLNSLKLALKHAHLFPHLHHAAPHKLLEQGEWRSIDGKINWKLVPGDFKENFTNCEPADVIWFDPFSYKTDTEMWNVELFSKLRVSSKPSTELYTYSASTAVRSTLLAANWWVAKGSATGPKESTTIAYATCPNDRSQLLCAKWLERWKRSDSKYPFGDNSPAILDLILQHPQFSTISAE